MPTVRTATQAGWAESRYNLFAWPPDGDDPIVANLYAGTMGKVPLLEYALLKSLDRLPETHPVLERLAKRGLIVNFDEHARLEKRRAGNPARQRRIRLTICPAMACNFDCPYCFQNHRAGTMSEAVQDDVAALAERLLATSGADELSIVWYGGEPLLAPEVIKRLTRLLEAACSKHGAGIRASVLTNGYLLDREMVLLLAANRVKSVRVTVDGLGPTHDATRHLVGGGNTFDRVMDNLSARIPFPVEVRMNVHAGNVADADALHARVADIAHESGNKLVFRKAHVYDSEAALSRNRMPHLLDEQSLKQLSLDYGSFALGRANANSDVDLIVEMPPGVVLGRSFFDLRRELKEAFGRTVDLYLPPNGAARAEYVRVLERTKVLVFDESSER